MLSIKNIGIIITILLSCISFLFAQTDKKKSGIVENKVEIEKSKVDISKPITTENIDWSVPETIRKSDGTEIKTLSFGSANFNPDVSILPIYTKYIEGALANIKITDATYKEIDEAEQKLIATATISNNPKIETETGYVYGKPFTTIYITPIRKNTSTGKLEKLVNFNITTENNNSFKTTANKLTSSYTYNSVLSTGNWYKIAVSSDGIYKLDKNFLNSIGINTATLTPKNIKIYGYGGGMLPQANSTLLYDDLPENAIFVEGENDGVFNDNDYILFYAQGPDKWKLNASYSLFESEKNLYSDLAFYFINISGIAGKRITTKPQESSSAETFNYFDDRQHFEIDLKNMNRTGREWFGDEFKQTLVKTYTFNNFSNIIAGSDLKIYSGVFTQSPAASIFTVKLNGVEIGKHSLNATSINFYEYKEIGAVSNLYFIRPSAQFASNPTFNFEYSYSKPNVNSVGYHNFTTVNAKRELRLYGNYTAFRTIASKDVEICTYRLIAPSNAIIWDVTDPTDIKQQQYSVVSGSEIEFITSTENKVREYTIFNSNNFNSPTSLGAISNQNLHAMSGVNFIILSSPQFVSQATQLANQRNAEGLVTRIITPQQIYDEFSSGRQDISAIRNFLKMLYDRSLATSNTADDLKYLLLFGDCSYDYKNRVPNNTNFVPIYQSREYISQVATFSSDDFYGFLDDNEGEWVEGTSGNLHRLDIGIGRIPAKNNDEATLAVNKILNYSKNNPQNLGKWRNYVTLIADDGDDCLHLNDAETFSRLIEDYYKNYHPNKIYLDDYIQPYGATGQTSPDCKQAIKNALEKGSLITNYTGHGNEFKLTSETVVDFQSINSWTNTHKLTFLVTGTCDFGRYDDPALTSGGEQAFIMAKGGAVSLLTTTRPVFSFSNKLLNNAFYNSIFTPIDNEMPRLGDVQKTTKNNSVVGVNNRNFALLGDPTLRLAYPQYDINITKINNNAVETLTVDTLKALMKVTIEGNVTNNNELISNFNGKMNASVYEKLLPFKTLGNEKGRDGITDLCDYTARKNVIFDGSVTVINGNFKFSFIVPKDINYEYGFGKILLYADNGSIDAHGFNNNVMIGGSQEGVAPDNTPPVINLYLNDESFVFGGLTGVNSLLIGKMYDENGINTSGLGIGHDITAILDGDINNIKVLNEYYSADLDQYQSGRIEYPYEDLKPGVHNLKVKAWDTHNNSAEGYLEFIVADNANLALSHVLNYPNPFSTFTTFHFDHNRPGTDMETKIDIFTVTGKLIKTLITRDYFSKSHFSDLSWNGRDEYDDKIGNGVYVYKVTVRSLTDGTTKQVYEKLVILN